MEDDRTAQWVLVASLIAGLSYLWPVTQNFAPQAELIIWKGMGVGLLTVYAALRARSPSGWLITLVMACGAAGDVLLDAVGITAGAIAFLVGHGFAILLYARNRRAVLSFSQAFLALLLVPVVVYVAWRLPVERDGALMIAAYAFGLAIMAAMAWTSRFPRYRTGIGALMFVASDLLIFARMGPLAGSLSTSVAIWLLYFWGQLQIVRGVTGVLSADPVGKPGAIQPLLRY